MEKLVAVLLSTVAAVASAADCRWAESAADAAAISVVCRPSVIYRAFEVGERGEFPVSHVTSLTVRCDDDAEAQSRLTNATFSRLTGLTALRVERCRMATLPAAFDRLTQLRSLAVTSSSQDLSLVVESGALDALSSLQQLDLSHNQLWALPSRLLCHLPSLQRLRLSHNLVQDVDGLGLGRQGDVTSRAQCRQSELVALDLSHNRVSSVCRAMWAALPSLRELSVSQNRIELLEDGALDGLHALRRLDLSGNRLVTLPDDLFLATPHVTKLRLANNSLSALTPGLFRGLDHLQMLDLSGNQLTPTWVNSRTFSGLVRLVVLDVSRNSLSQIDPAMLADLYSLQILKLHHNQIDTIFPDTFAVLSNLHTLVLSHNRLHRIDTLSFNGLQVLSSLALDHNMIEVVQTGAFGNASGLKDVTMGANRLTQVPEAITALHLLENLDVSDNNISSLDGGTFAGLHRLRGLHLEGNMVTNVTQALLINLPQLRVLDLADNLLSMVQPGAFESNAYLEAIRLDGNRLTDMTGLFNNLPSLRWLNISDNQIADFDYSMLPRSLQWLDLHKNRISELENSDDMANQISITTLDVSFNRLTSLSGRSLPSSNVLLMLNDNQIRHVEQYTFFLMTNISRVDLYANQITSMELNALRLNILNSTANIPEFYIGGNPFSCDCSMEWLHRYDQMDQLRHYPRIMDLESIYCRLAYSREGSFVPLVDTVPSMFLCSYATHCFTTCHCCEFDACDCEMTCPDKCSCFHDQSWSSNIIDCSNSDFGEIPDRVPMDATEVYLDGNVLHNLSSLTFLGRKNMRVLYLNGSRIELIHNETFVGLSQLTTLHLETNLLSELRGHEWVGLEQLRELYLHNNRLRRIADGTFTPLPHLQVVRLDGNQLVTFSVWQLQRNAYLVDVRLAGNRWSCRCGFLRRLRSWLRANSKKVDDLRSLVCRFHGESRRLQIYTGNNTCYARQTDLPAMAMTTSEYVIIVVSTLAVVVLLGCLLVIVSVYRADLRLWIHSRCGVRVCYSSSVLDEEHGRMFDAFVSHSDSDRSFVQHVLVPRLECGDPPYRLALHGRDFAHSAYLADTIVEAVESSRRTIMVLSKNFVENEWCRFQFKSAHHEVLKDRGKRLIVVMLGDVSHQDLDPDLRLCMKANTCISWHDRLFWEKLRFAMPDVKSSHQVIHSESHYSEIDESHCYGRSPDTVESVYG